jgi:serine/threonine-protein kinase
MEGSSGTPGLGPGERLGPYVLDTVLGEGAIGVVFRAAADDGSLVALKILKRQLSTDDVYRRRFAREARVARAVRHRHLVPILDLGEARGYHYLAVEYVDGGSLRDRLDADGPLAVDRSIELAAQVASAIDALHAQGIIHRDVKPANVMLDRRGQAAVTDFGLAKGRAYTVLTTPGHVMGTLDYIAPELIRGEQAGPAGDVYALGCLVYECLSGAPPFGDRHVLDVVNAHLEGTAPDLSAQRPDVPRALAEVVESAMAKLPEQRPRTGTAFAHLLRAASRSMA